MASYESRKATPPLPPLTARHVYDWLMEIGPTESGSMGQGPISWGEISDWADRTFTLLSAWEARALRRLSVEYLSESRHAEDRYRPAPWSPTGDQVDREAEEAQLRSVLG